MLQARFSKEGMEHYMVLSGGSEWKEGYQSNLFQYHNVPCFLQYDVRRINDTIEIYYRLRYHTSLRSVIGHLPFTMERLKNMAVSIIEAMEMTEEYLLDLEGILWQTDKVFMEADTGKLQFCYYPSQEKAKGTVKGFLTEVIQAVDKKEEEAVLFVLQFYNLVTEPDCSLEDLRRFKREKVEDLPRISGIQEKNLYVFGEPDKEEKRKETATIPTAAEKEETGTGKRVIKILLAVTALVNLVLIICFLFNRLAYHSIRYLFISFGALIILTIIYMHFTKEETADEMMQEFFESQERKGNPEPERPLSPQKKLETEGMGETSILIKQEEKAQSTETVQGKEEMSLCLRAMEQDKYPPICIKDSSVVLGCMPEGCDYVLQARGISRMHAKLMEKADGIYLLDLNSTNGTYLNGNSVESGQDYKLEEGDMVTFAMSEFYVAVE